MKNPAMNIFFFLILDGKKNLWGRPIYRRLEVGVSGEEGSALCAFRQCLHKTKIEFLRAFVIEDNLNLIPETKDC